MADSPKFKKNGKIVTFCGGGNCCPTLDVDDPNNAKFSDKGVTIYLDADQLQGMEDYFVARAAARK